MAIAFVLGNGISRRGLPLEPLRSYGTIYGCNALYREFTPDVLVATDTPISLAIQEAGYSKTNKFYTRKPMENSGALAIPKDYYGFSSGPAAVAIAVTERHRKIYLIGFDMGPAENNRINNIYAGTEFYRSTDAQPIYAGNWIKQIKSIAQKFPTVAFIRVMGPNTATITDFDPIPNITNLNLTALQERINNSKDL